MSLPILLAQCTCALLCTLHLRMGCFIENKSYECNKQVQWFVGVENFGRSTFAFFGYPSILIAGSKLAWGMPFCFVLWCFSSVEVSTVVLNKDIVNWTVRGGPDRNTSLKIYLFPNNWTWLYIYIYIYIYIYMYTYIYIIKIPTCFG